MVRSDSPKPVIPTPAIIALVLSIGFWVSPLQAIVYTVGPSGTYGNIQAAINIALDGAITDIRVEKGFTYHENLLIPSSLDEVAIVLTGGWNGSFSARDTSPENTIIDGGGGRVLDVRLAGVSFTVDGFTLTNGGAERGAGVYVLPNGNAKVTIENVRINGNTATSTGQSSGGGLRAELENTERLEVRNCRIRDNDAISTEGAQAIGGGLSILATGDSTFLIQGCEIDHNTIESNGGALMGGGVSLIVTGAAQGELLDSYPVENTAIGTNRYASGGHFETRGSGNLEIERCGFIFNSFEGGGAGPQARSVATDSSSLLIGDSGIAQGNSVALSSYSYGTATVNIVNLTVADHTTNGIYLSQSDSSVLTLYNSIAFNSGPNLTTIGTVDAGSNLIGVDPLFVNPVNMDYHLRPGSPALDAGDNSPPGGLGAMDFDGNPRILSGTVDIGMYEGAAIVVFANGFEEGDTSAWSLTLP